MTTIRASSWADLFDCPARWYAKNVQGLRLPSSGAAALGTAVHAGTAQIVPFRTRGKKTVQDWPMPPMGGAA